MTRTIRTLTLADIETLLGWAAAEGWNPGLRDASAFRAADPHGFFGAFVDDVMVAAIAAVAYDNDFGFVGLYICHPEWRGQGHGRAVWDAGMAYLGGRTIGLDGVPEQSANYARMGFVPLYETIRMSGTLTATRSASHAIDVAEIETLDRLCFSSGRGEFLRHWIAPPNRIMVCRKGPVVTGYAVIRACREGDKIGPLFAHTIEDATALLDTISGAVQIDVPGYQTEWKDALASRGLRPGFRTARMYRGLAPRIALTNVFGITSLELG